MVCYFPFEMNDVKGEKKGRLSYEHDIPLAKIGIVPPQSHPKSYLSTVGKGVVVS